MKVFVSHCSDERVLADSLATLIRAMVPECEVCHSSDFPDRGGIGAGERWHSWILRQLETSTITLVVLTHQSARNDWRLWEAGVASGVALSDDNRTVIPCLYGLDEERMPAPLALYQAVKPSTEQGLSALVSAIAHRCPGASSGSDGDRKALDACLAAGKAFTETIAWRVVTRKLTPLFVLLPSLRDDPFYLDLLAGLTSALPADFDLSLRVPGRAYSGAGYADELADIVQTQGRYQGGIIAPTLADGSGARVKSLISQFKIPNAIVDINPFESDPLPAGTAYLGFDNALGGRIAAEALLHEIGSRRPCSILVLASKDQPERHEAFLRALPKDVETMVDFCAFSRDAARELVSRRLRHERRQFHAIFGVSDEMALGALEAANREDLVVVGYDGTNAARTLIDLKASAFRNTIVQDPFTLGEQAMSLLVDMIRGRRQASTVTLPVDCYVRL